MYTPEIKAEFENVFGKSMNSYVSYVVGFNPIKFVDHLLPEWENSDKSAFDMIEERYGAAGSDVIKAIVEWETENGSPHVDNSHLKGCEDGIKADYKVDFSYNPFNHEQRDASGIVYYPFAYRKVSRATYRVDHLPSGLMLLDVVGKTKAIQYIMEIRDLFGVDFTVDSLSDLPLEALNRGLEITNRYR